MADNTAKEGEDELDDFVEVTSDFDWTVCDMALMVREAGGVGKAIKGWLDTKSTAYAIKVAREEVEVEVKAEVSD